jgi:hypothetical protein
MNYKDSIKELGKNLVKVVGIFEEIKAVEDERLVNRISLSEILSTVALLKRKIRKEVKALWGKLNGELIFLDPIIRNDTLNHVYLQVNYEYNHCDQFGRRTLFKNSKEVCIREGQKNENLHVTL